MAAPSLRPAAPVLAPSSPRPMREEPSMSPDWAWLGRAGLGLAGPGWAWPIRGLSWAELGWTKEPRLENLREPERSIIRSIIHSSPNRAST